MNVVELEKLCKSYAGKFVVENVDLLVKSGQVVSIIGPNGAGKTTTVEIIEGHRKATSGSVRTLGSDPTSKAGFRQIRGRIGVTLQSTHYEPTLTVNDFIYRQSSYYSTILSPDYLVDALSLDTYRNDHVGSLSGGTVQRLAVMLALIGNPELVILDEPTAGLDPVSRRKVVALIKDLRASDMTVLLTSHNLDEIQEVADNIVVMEGGRIRFTGSVDSIIAESGVLSEVNFDSVGKSADSLPLGASFSEGRVAYKVKETDDLVQRLRQWEQQNNVGITGLSILHPTLEDAYVQLVKETTE